MVEISFSTLKDRTPETSAKLVKYRELFSTKSKEEEKRNRIRKRDEMIKQKAEDLLIKNIRDSGVKLAFEDSDDFEEGSKRQLLRGLESAHPSGAQVSYEIQAN